MRRRARTNRKRTRLISNSIPISVIIPTGNEERTIRRVIIEAKKINSKTEVIVVCNGVTDRTASLAKKAGAKVIEYTNPLGHDIGRAIGAKSATGEVVLFIDADFVIPAPVLRKYCREVINGWDVVLNSFSGITSRRFMHPTSQAKRILNRMLGRPDLLGSSFTTVPHACSKKAIATIGIENLAVPPKAQAKAILTNLKILRGHYLYTPRLNRKRRGRKNTILDLVIGDHIEAITSLMTERGSRGGFTDFMRKRFVTTRLTQVTLPGSSGGEINQHEISTENTENPPIEISTQAEKNSFNHYENTTEENNNKEDQANSEIEPKIEEKEVY